MPEDTVSLIQVLLTVFVAVITCFAIAGAVQAWRSRRRIEKFLGRR